MVIVCWISPTYDAIFCVAHLYIYIYTWSHDHHRFGTSGIIFGSQMGSTIASTEKITSLSKTIDCSKHGSEWTPWYFTNSQLVFLTIAFSLEVLQGQTVSSFQNALHGNLNNNLSCWCFKFQPTWKNILQSGSFPQVRAKMKTIWNHHLELRVPCMLHVTKLPTKWGQTYRNMHSDGWGPPYSLEHAWRQWCKPNTLLKTNIGFHKWWFGKWFSSPKGWLSRPMLHFGCV